MNPDVLTESFELWTADVIVLFDWLMSVDLNAVPISHPAQKQALADLLTCLEAQTHAVTATAEDIAFAQAQVAADMGW